MKENLEKRVVGLFFLMLAIIIGVAYASVRNIQKSRDTTGWVNHVHAVILDANALAASLHAGDASMSQYLLEGDRRDQENYRSSYNAMNERLVDIKALTRGDASETGQQLLIDKLEKILAQHINFTRTVVQARQQGGEQAARQAMQSTPEGESTTEIDRVIGSITSLEDSALVQRDKDAVAQEQATKYVVWTGVIVNFGLLLFASVLIRDDLHARRVAATALEEANAQLEAKVQERTAELVKTNQALKKENLERRWSYQALDHQLRYNQLIVNSISEMVFVVSKALNVSRVNPAVTQVTQWEPQEIISQALDRVMQLPASDGPSNPIISALNDGRELQERPAIVTTKSGNKIAVRFNLVPLRDDNKVVGGVVTVRPVPGAAPTPATV